MKAKLDVLSVYLSSAEKQTPYPSDLISQLHSLAHQNLESVEQKRWKKDLERMEMYLRGSFDRENKRSVVFFSSGKSIWQVLEFEFFLPPLLLVYSSPYFKPLERASKEYRKYLVLLVDREKARLFTVHLGKIEEHKDIFVGEVPQKVKAKKIQYGREMKRNMKHYIRVFPELRKEEAVEIYAPYDGFISVIRADMGDKLEGEIWIAPDRGILTILPPFNLWMFSFEHVEPRKGLKVGDKVEAGELIGHASFLVAERTDPTFDVIYGTMGLPMKKLDNWNSPFGNLDSIFNHMSDEVLAKFAQKGITRENIILNKEERDNNPCTYRDQGPYFIDDKPDNWLTLQ